MNNMSNGSHILKLLDSLTPDPLSKSVQALYHEANATRIEDTGKAIALCQKALGVLDSLSTVIVGTSEAKTYARGRFHLLIASIYLDQASDITEAVFEDDDILKKAEQHYDQSRRQFHVMQWSHLESLAYLGLAITQCKLKRFKEASQACENAQQYVDDYSLPSQIDKLELLQAIAKEREVIQETLSPEIEPVIEVEDKPGERELPIFQVSAGIGIIAGGSTTKLNILSREDYEYNIHIPPEKVIVDLKKCPHAKEANYILEINEGVEAIGGLQRHDWVLITGEKDLGKLSNGVTVIVLERDQGTIYASLRTLLKYKDHYFLKAKDEKISSIVVVPYGSDLSKLETYYTIDGGAVVRKRVDEIQVCGAVIDSPIRQNPEGIAKAFIWPVPLFSVTNEPPSKYIYIRKNSRRDSNNYVCMVAPDDSMENGGIPNDGIMLLHRQGTIDNGQIGLLHITAPNLSLKVIRYYYLHEQPNLLHWFLRAGNPFRESFLIIPPDTDAELVEQMYEANRGRDNLRVYRDANVAILGKYIEMVPMNEES